MNYFRKCSLLLLLVGSTLQYGDIVVSRYFVPMTCIFIAIFLAFIIPIRMSRFQLHVLAIHVVFFYVFVLLSLFGHSSAEEFFFDLIKLFLAFCMSFFVFYYVSTSDDGSIKFCLNAMFISALIFLLLELYGRLAPLLSNIAGIKQNFYIAKVSSPFMVDSNAVGLYALFYFVAYISTQKLLSHRRLTKAIFFTGFSFFIVLTFSRAAIIAGAMVFVMYYWEAVPRLLRYFASLFGVFVFMYMVYLIIDYVAADGSGTTKLAVLYRLPELMGQVDVRGMLFGFGVNEGNYAYSYDEDAYSHLLFPMILGQFGVLGLIFYVLFFFVVCVSSKWKARYLVVSMLVVGLSYLHPFLETLFLVSGLCLGLVSAERLFQVGNDSVKG